MTLAEWLAIANFLIVILGLGGGVLTFRSALAKSEAAVQERVRAALTDENELLRNRVQRLETENKRQARLMALIVTTLKKLHNIDLDIEEDVITLRSPGGAVSRVSTDI